MTPQEISKAISDMGQKLKDTMEAVNYSRGPVRDTMQLVIPMMEDQLEILEKITEALAGHMEKLEHMPSRSVGSV